MDIVIEALKGIVSAIVYFWWLFVILFGLLAWQNFRKTKWVKNKEDIVLEIKIPKTNDKNPTAAEMMFATLHGILKPKKDLMREGSLQEHISFEFVADQSTIRFFVWTPKHLKDFVEGQIYAQYPSAEITVADDYSKRQKIEEEKGRYHISGAELALTKADYLPIKTFNNFQVDPLAGITGVLSKLEDEGEEIWIQILARPVSDEWKKRGLAWVARKKGQFVGPSAGNFLEWITVAPVEFVMDLFRAALSGPIEAKDKSKSASTEDEGRISAVEEKSQKLAYGVKIRIMYIAGNDGHAAEKMQAAFGAFKQFNTTNLNGFKGKKVYNVHDFLHNYQNRVFLDKGYHLNIEELASIYHLPHTSVETPNINWTASKTAEAPTDLPTPKNTPVEELTIFAETNFRGHKNEFGIKRDDRRRHMYIIGKSGMGKTKLQELLVTHDINKGEGVAVMDPHGDFIVDILKKIPKERIDDVILFDPADTNYPIAFNPMEVFDDNLKNQIASGIVATFKKIFGTSWGPRLEYILNYTVLALLDTPDSTLLGIVNMLTDKNYRKKIVANIKDPVVKKFWTTEFASYNEKFATEAIAPILNKVGQFVANSLIRNVIGQPKSSYNIREAMDNKKILLINLSTGRVGETNASLMGSLMITAIQLAAMSRADMAETKRTDFYLYVDEFQNFATESFKNILSEARKYHLNLTIAHQYIAQMEDSGVREAIFGNVGTMITFRVGAEDANVLAKEFNPPFEVEDLVNLERQNIYIKMTVDGKAEAAFSARTLPVTTEEAGYMEETIKRSRDKYTRPKEIVEKEVVDWSHMEEGESRSEANSEEESFEAPIVKSLGGKKSNRDEVSKAIAENTAHLAQKKHSVKSLDISSFGLAETTKLLEQSADYIVRHRDHDDKFVFLPENKPKFIIPDPKGRVKGGIYEKGGSKIYDVKIDMFVPGNFMGYGKDKAPDIWVGTENEIISQLEAIMETSGGGTRFLGIVDNTESKGKLEKKLLEREKRLSKPGTVKEKIDKEILAEILKKVVTPAEPEETAKDNRQSAPASKHEKVITPQTFKKVKAIHPHETVTVQGKPTDIAEGEEIKFN